MQVVETIAQERGEDDDDDSDEEEARFEVDTESFMMRQRELNFPGLPPGASRGRHAQREKERGRDREAESPGAEDRNTDLLLNNSRYAGIIILFAAVTVGKKRTWRKVSVPRYPSIHQSTYSYTALRTYVCMHRERARDAYVHYY